MVTLGHVGVIKNTYSYLWRIGNIRIGKIRLVSSETEVLENNERCSYQIKNWPARPGHEVSDNDFPISEYESTITRTLLTRTALARLMGDT